MAKKSISKAGDQPKPYHHGNLVEALIAATVELIEERGVEQVSVREVAKRAGVSPGAPFRHFRSKTALLTAVAEQAMDRLTESVAKAVSEASSDDPAAAFEAIGHGYLEWALANPTHFQIISSRTLIDFEASASLRDKNAAIRETMVELLTQAQHQGRLAPDVDLNHLVLAARAYVYGLARMAIDGHFPEWHPSEPPAIAVRRALRIFMGQMIVSTKSDLRKPKKPS
ncbi:TetR/AcrR family transcriptional regulator [Microvirga rosea]|uniref:TetR/AcrR family transcriptional regulator n=1 Tax=Microvirga rosea TaxID=2715425 RepID=UPI001D0A2236|nr:TetR/AcrR family transcriptional regulator [Microvirga rosea]MCB8819428.1 TetR/AcrR family transcriptional regulator [Microvirga rosea]